MYTRNNIAALNGLKILKMKSINIQQRISMYPYMNYMFMKESMVLPADEVMNCDASKVSGLCKRKGV